MIAAILVGLLSCYCTIQDTRSGKISSVEPSNSLLEFTFLNK